eukprot:CAMPEP_0179175170 /NCGR_PEP_ID=MMETSP0796-20121207/86500_1 /TAXON_ID=73915 /ORGANISM="Pyrodinium bahamense, Strain pbaha01" /LENGTH=443 /DNA_ID=CAMNT_0020878489 /DNA_START=22 /DNA_END=1354 /DNA_ORIENTATION=+
MSHLTVLLLRAVVLTIAESCNGTGSHCPALATNGDGDDHGLLQLVARSDPSCAAYLTCSGLSGNCCPDSTEPPHSAAAEVRCVCNRSVVDGKANHCPALGPNGDGDDHGLLQLVARSDPSCAAYHACSNLSGNCCPDSTGLMLSCCSASSGPSDVQPVVIIDSVACAANPACSHLSGDCCPPSTGEMLACCESLAAAPASSQSKPSPSTSAPPQQAGCLGSSCKVPAPQRATQTPAPSAGSLNITAFHWEPHWQCAMSNAACRAAAVQRFGELVQESGAEIVGAVELKGASSALPGWAATQEYEDDVSLMVGPGWEVLKSGGKPIESGKSIVDEVCGNATEECAIAVGDWNVDASGVRGGSFNTWSRLVGGRSPTVVVPDSESCCHPSTCCKYDHLATNIPGAESVNVHLWDYQLTDEFSMDEEHMPISVQLSVPLGSYEVSL